MAEEERQKPKKETTVEMEEKGSRNIGIKDPSVAPNSQVNERERFIIQNSKRERPKKKLSSFNIGEL
ncbi:hypothetical protein YC2023_116167 [Brassica napus]